jgi:hypothetical protein
MENNRLYQRFVHWVCREDIRTKLERNCRYSELIMLELNHVYEPWYGKPPNLSRIDGDLKSYLAVDIITEL